MQPAATYRFQLLSILAVAALLLLAGSWFSYTSTFDTATVGLMSVNINNGVYPIFFYGQPYFGALEAYLGALFISFFGFSEFAVSLAPISFTLLWVIFTYLLFSRILNKSGGLVAALCVAFPGYYVFWYSIATYGGYSAILCLGTAILWLSLLIYQEKPRGFILFLYSLFVGILTATGIWVHALTFPYIGLAGAVLALFAVQERFRFDIVVSFGAAFAVALTGFIPFEIETGSFLGGLSPGVSITWPRIEQTVTTLFAINIRELVVWNFLRHLDSAVVSYLVVFGSRILLIGAAVFACISLFLPAVPVRRKLYYLIPISFCLLFLSMYVQHHMATVKAPRYAISFWTMLLCLTWSVAIAGNNNRFVKKTALLLFAFWLVLQVSGTVLFIKGNSEGAREEQRSIQAVVDAARENNLKSVVTYGDRLLGYKAQKFSMFSQNSIVFSNAELERYDGNAQFSDLDTQRGYLTNFPSKVSLENTFKELGVRYKITKVNNYFLFTNIDISRHFRTKAVPYEILKTSSNKISGDASLNDGNQDNGFQDSIDNMPTTLDIGEVKLLSGIWMFTSQDPGSFNWDRPGPFEIYASSDNITYTKIFKSLPNTGNGFFAGDDVFIGGPWGKIDVRFDPVAARYLQIKFLNDKTSRITEAFIFETDSSTRVDSAKDLAFIQKIITERDLQFVWADRYISANLLEMNKSEGKTKIALPRHSTKYTYKPLQYFIHPQKGYAVVCDASVSEYCENSLMEEYGNGVIAEKFDLLNYSLYVLDDIDIRHFYKKHSVLLWNGHVPLQTKETKLLAYWLHSQGVPVWRPDYTKTSGIYPDLWTNGDGKFEDLSYIIQKEFESKLVIHLNGQRPQEEMSDLQFEVTVNDSRPLKFIEKSNNIFVFELPGDLKKVDCIGIKSSTFTHKGRILGLDIKRLEIR